ncbi:MAG TPA: ammonia-forming cytochrome c nitrite reductase subunit c552 [Thermoflexales bacterium]|nr:ammonia-forming cytochrome c nitrite reductase subunit c552 [Thermoflexales bacterium]
MPQSEGAPRRFSFQIMRKTTPRSLPTGAYFVIFGVLALLTAGVLLLMQSVSERQREGRQDAFRVVPLTEDVVDPAVWGQNYPNQYDSYKRTVDVQRTRYGGSEAIQKLDDDRALRVIFNGYAFGTDYREERGHAYMLIDQNDTERVKQFKQPGACLNCHASVAPAFYQKGVEAGAPASDRAAAIKKGFDVVNVMPYADAAKLVQHPITCNDCHNPENMQLRITRPAFLAGIDALAKSKDAVPHLPSIERWRAAGSKGDFNPNLEATRQEMRSFVCAQCHVEYYFKGAEKTLTFPWQNGLKVEQIASYYDAVGWKDWVHKDSGSNSLKAQHPEFEMWSQGVHAASGVACADCHMPYERVGAVKASDHWVRSPMLNINNACQGCHKFSETELKNRVTTIQDRTRALMTRAEDAVVGLIQDLAKAKAGGATDAQLAKAQDLQRTAQWRLDFVAAENSMGFHAPGESARILGESIDYARQGQIELLKVVKPTSDLGAPVATKP